LWVWVLLVDGRGQLLYCYALSDGVVGGGSRVSQSVIHPCCERVRATEHTPRGLCRLPERIHGLAEIVERTSGVRRRIGCGSPQ